MNKPKCKFIKVPENLDLKTWLETQANQHQFKYLLAHAEDGVIWGKFQSEKLITADEVFPPQFAKLRRSTLQQCRIFGENSEVMLWKTDEGFKARVIQDEKNTDFIPENQILWGTKAEEIRNGFTLISDGSQGLRHAVPLIDIAFNGNQNLYRPLRLCVRHYLDDDKETGLVRIYLSRLVNLTTEKELKNAA
ncbi:MAG: TIGR03984 family CRISPR-associated protein [Methylacidiphilales bacterium]|nr:TIGR03984 family CRISPR-associated protein [Candidatus Methylacidiphilales bacterium]NJR18405.1 TIGR03984 family CRISPR-associated protein [Calothrix sp. CSU_2_0]